MPTGDAGQSIRNNMFVYKANRLPSGHIAFAAVLSCMSVSGTFRNTGKMALKEKCAGAAGTVASPVLFLSPLFIPPLMRHAVNAIKSLTLTICWFC